GATNWPAATNSIWAGRGGRRDTAGARCDSDEYSNTPTRRQRCDRSPQVGWQRTDLHAISNAGHFHVVAFPERSRYNAHQRPNTDAAANSHQWRNADVFSDVHQRHGADEQPAFHRYLTAG